MDNGSIRAFLLRYTVVAGCVPSEVVCSPVERCLSAGMSAFCCSQESRDLLNWFSDTMAPDEYVWPTLNHNPQLHAPGSYKGEFSYHLLV